MAVVPVITARPHRPWYTAGTTFKAQVTVSCCEPARPTGATVDPITKKPLLPHDTATLRPKPATSQALAARAAADITVHALQAVVIGTARLDPTRMAFPPGQSAAVLPSADPELFDLPAPGSQAAVACDVIFSTPVIPLVSADTQLARRGAPFSATLSCRLPDSAPPTYRGQGVRFVYSLNVMAVWSSTRQGHDGSEPGARQTSLFGRFWSGGAPSPGAAESVEDDAVGAHRKVILRCPFVLRSPSAAIMHVPYPFVAGDPASLQCRAIVLPSLPSPAVAAPIADELLAKDVPPPVPRGAASRHALLARLQQEYGQPTEYVIRWRDGTPVGTLVVLSTVVRLGDPIRGFVIPERAGPLTCISAAVSLQCDELVPRSYIKSGTLVPRSSTLFFGMFRANHRADDDGHNSASQRLSESDKDGARGLASDGGDDSSHGMGHPRRSKTMVSPSNGSLGPRCSDVDLSHTCTDDEDAREHAMATAAEEKKKAKGRDAFASVMQYQHHCRQRCATTDEARVVMTRRTVAESKLLLADTPRMPFTIHVPPEAAVASISTGLVQVEWFLTCSFDVVKALPNVAPTKRPPPLAPPQAGAAVLPAPHMLELSGIDGRDVAAASRRSTCADSGTRGTPTANGDSLSLQSSMVMPPARPAHHQDPKGSLTVLPRVSSAPVSVAASPMIPQAQKPRLGASASGSMLPVSSAPLWPPPNAVTTQPPSSTTISSGTATPITTPLVSPPRKAPARDAPLAPSGVRPSAVPYVKVRPFAGPPLELELPVTVYVEEPEGAHAATMTSDTVRTAKLPAVVVGS